MDYETNLLLAYEKIQSGRLKERSEGLTQLKQIITHGDNARILNDKAYLKMFEAIFRATSEEKKAVKSKAPTQAVLNRISQCGNTLRAAVEVGTRNLRGKSVRALTVHVADTLSPTNKKEFVEALRLDYVKCIRILLEYPPHREHLVADEWSALMEFCCGYVSDDFKDDGRNSPLPMNGRNDSQGSVSRSNSSLRSVVHSQTRLRSDTEEVIVCISLMLSSPNASIFGHGEEIGSTLVKFLSAHRNITRAHYPALSALAHLFEYIGRNDVELTSRFCEEVLPIIARMWSSKLPNIREQLIIILIHITPHLRKDLRSPSKLETRERLDQLVQIMLEDLRSRHERDCLMMEDIEFEYDEDQPSQSYPLALDLVRLKETTNTKKELLWAVPKTLGTLINLIDLSHSQLDGTHGEQESAGKRRRISLYFDEVLGDIRAGSTGTVLPMLQLVPFMLYGREVEKDDVVTILTSSLRLCSSDDRTLAAWAMINIACCGTRKSTFLRDENLTTMWMDAWKIGQRNITSAATYRAACHMLYVIMVRELVPFSAIADDVENILTQPELNGPSGLCDSAFAFWRAVMHRRSVTAFSSSLLPGEKLMQWLVSKWKPGETLDRATAPVFCRNIPAPCLIRFLLSASGSPTTLHNANRGVTCGDIGQAILRLEKVKDLHKLFLLEDDVPNERGTYGFSTLLNDAVPSISNATVEKRMLAFFDRSRLEIREKWSVALSNPQFITPEMVYNHALFLLAATFMTSISDHDEEKGERLAFHHSCQEVAADLELFLKSPDARTGHIDSMLKAAEFALPQISSIVTYSCRPESAYYGFFGKVLQILTKSITQRLAVKEEEEDDDGHMDIDEDFDMDINERRKEKDEDALTERNEVHAGCSEAAYRSHCTTLLSLLAISIPQPTRARLGSEFMAYLSSISPGRAILSRLVIKDFLSHASDLRLVEDANLIQHFGEDVLQDYGLERCEPGILLCIDCATAMVPKWTPTIVDDDLRICCESLYDWLLKIALGKKIASPIVRIAIANLLQCIMDSRLEYGNNSELKSARTNFILLLEDVDFQVQYHMANNIPHVFDLVAVNLHYNVYKDVHKHLPKQVESVEGLAIRLFALSRISTESLGTRKALVYHMFETGQFEIAREYAMRSLSTLAKGLGLENSQKLFRLYSSQIIFTWLGNFPLLEFPITIAGYKTFREFCDEHTEEIVAQLIATYKDNQAEQVADILGVEYEKLIVLSFYKIMAYGLCADAKFAGKEGAGSPIGHRMRNVLKGKYEEMIMLEHPRIFGALFEVMEPDGLFDKLFQKFASEMLHARPIMDQISNISYSSASYTDALKPNYSALAVVSSINYIANGLNCDPSTIWTPTLFTFVARKLLNTINPAYGRIHAATVIRKLRLLICFAGPVLADGYPLEMMLHSLTPFITDSFCAEDTIGIIQYLLVTGKIHLARRPGFTAGTFLSMLAILKTFLLGASQSSTEQSQYESSQSRAQSFRSWLEEYVTDYKSTAINDAQNEVLHQILLSALGFKSPGNALKETQEGQLLKLILQDESNDKRLLDNVSKRMTFKLLVRNFQRPASFRQDVVGDDTDSVALSKVLFRICRSYDMSEGFLVWVGRVFGRAFAASGAIHKEWTREVDLEPTSKVARPNYKDYGIDCMSRAKIYNHLADILVSDDRMQVGLAEKTLINIIYRDTISEGGTLADLALPTDLLQALQWKFNPLENDDEVPEMIPLEEAGKYEGVPYEAWITRLATAVSTNMESDPIGGRLSEVLQNVPSLPEKLFQYLVHLCLCTPEKENRVRLSKLFRECIRDCSEATVPHVSVLIKTVVYLRTQPVAEEETELDRDDWLDLDYLELSGAASICKLFKTALLFAEIHSSKMQSNYTVIPSNLLINIYKNIDEPDSFYGVTQEPTLETSLMKFEYEGENWKCLSFRGARLESSMKFGATPASGDSSGLVNSFNGLGLSGLSHIFQHSQAPAQDSLAEQDKVFQSAWKLAKWDLPCPPKLKSESAVLYRALQTVNNSLDTSSIPKNLDVSFLDVMQEITQSKQTSHTLATNMRTLAMLTEVEEILTSSSESQLMETAQKLGIREKWMHTESFDKVDKIISARQTAFTSLAKQPHLREAVSIDEKAAILMEARALMGVCKMARSHNALQHSLSATMQLERLQHRAANVDLKMQDIVSIQVSNVLWDQGEAPSAIRSLQNLLSAHSPATGSLQDIPISRTKTLAKLGSWIAEARSLKPDLIVENYLEKAVRGITKDSNRDESGRVFHEFAVFCDAQLNDQGNREDFERIKKIRDAKQAEFEDIKKLLQMTKDKQEKRLVGKHADKAKKHLDLDNAEYVRLEKNRQDFLEKSLTNYLLCLSVTEKYESDAVRFCALWLEHYTNEAANVAVEKFIQRVSSRKFVAMINQLSSRLSGDASSFQRILYQVVYRMCRDHPYHGMYQMLSLVRAQTTDPAAQSRTETATHLTQRLRNDKSNKTSGLIWDNLYKTTKAFIAVAGITFDRSRRISGKQTMSSCGFNRDMIKFLERGIAELQIPPPTLNVPVRTDCDYSKLPIILKYSNEVTIASGLSAPKIMTCVSSDGQKRKMLMKGSDNDDLRQDAIMEQVFEQVSGLLQRSRATRQRNLTVRTYKVIPLTVSSGIIEFVADTMPLHDYLIPAHAKYRPKDWKQSHCRKIISEVDKSPRQDRLAVYQTVMKNFKPVMRYFYMHKFDGPDNWFAARTAYSRSTATNSMLGYVLGLGDRHGHNILLDQTSGEVIHIDLGVAFEQGRILPIPEVVPFRLTRDVVDGMGITKTEGVFRRCCEFTLSLLRDEAHNIITILDVLRYDPLYNWTISPLRMQRMQEAKDDERAEAASDAGIIEKAGVPKKEASEESEAERALLVVSKKLSKTLSVGATVSELIREATDERNLALLFSGWAAYI